MKYFFPLLLFLNVSLFAQNGVIKGTVKDVNTGEAVIGASVSYAPGKGVVTDIDGNYLIKIDSSGQYTLTISYIGYEAQSQKINVGSKKVVVNFSMQSQTLSEVEVVADVAKIRVTPVAFSNVSLKQIQEELGTRDMPMILNSTPGAYATEQGGGSGDSRINIRGFDQRNVAVMIDGIPVNDMENGQVYWSNWDGLSDITRTMQVQRGLGASKLAIPSVGGTINILTKGIDEKMGTQIKQEVNDYGLYKTSFGFNSGQLKYGWGVTIAGSRKWGNGWADGTFTDAWSYFGKVQKRFKKHLLSISANGAPQSHGQRADKLLIAVHSKSLAEKLGINADSIYSHSLAGSYSHLEHGLKYNPNWGILNGKAYNEKINYFHKPAFNLSHFWSPNDKLTVSNVLYLSIGKGGGTGMKTAITKRDTIESLLLFQDVYNDNLKTTIQPYYSSTLHPSSNYLRASINNHIWYGLISSWDYKVTKNFSALFGVDLRYYKGTHYQTPYDLLGGDYVIDATDPNQPRFSYIGDPRAQASVKHVDDKVAYYNDAKVMWGGLFAQAEYKKEKWSSFITGSISETGYQRIDYFKKKDLMIDDDLFAQAVGYGEGFYYNGIEHLTTTFGSSSVNGENTVVVSGDTTFIGTGANRKYILNAKKYSGDSPEARYSTTKRKWFFGYTIKAGANYNINDHMNAFVNIGYMNMAPRINTVFDNYNYEYQQIKNQLVYAIEGGYGLLYSKFSVNANLYYTYWKNKPFSGSYPFGGQTYSYNINGLDALHKGIELFINYKLLKNLSAEGIVSLADWKTLTGNKVEVTDENNTVITTIDFSAKNVHVGDAAQMQFGASLRYTIIKNLYIKPRFTYFGKHYANFDPTTLLGSNKDRESWKMPNYELLDFYAGYDLKIWKMNVGVTAGVVNVLNTVYISDAQNGAKYNATTALVYMGMGRRVNVALKIGF